MKKRILAVIAAFVLAMSFTACGDSADKDTDAKETKAKTTTVAKDDKDDKKEHKEEESTAEDDSSFEIPKEGIYYHDGFKIYINVDDTVVVEFLGDLNDTELKDHPERYPDVVVPTEIDGRKIAEYRNTGAYVNSVTFEGDVEVISTSAFDYSDVTKVILPDHLKELGTCVFEEADKLTEVKLPSHVDNIDEALGMFKGCDSLEKVEYPGTLKVMPFETFCNCEKLSEVTLGDGLEEIDSDVFDGCDSLKKLTIPDSVTKINEYAFGPFISDDLEVTYKGKTYKGDEIKKICTYSET